MGSLRQIVPFHSGGESETSWRIKVFAHVNCDNGSPHQPRKVKGLIASFPWAARATRSLESFAVRVQSHARMDEHANPLNAYGFSASIDRAVSKLVSASLSRLNVDSRPPRLINAST